MSKKLPVNGFKWIDNNETAGLIINEDFIKNYDENNDKGYIFEVDVKYPKRLVCNLYDKKKYVVHIKPSMD